MIKKKIFFHSNFCGLKTGFGGFMRELLSELYKTGKYELHLYSAGIIEGQEDAGRWPWKVHASLPRDPARVQQMQMAQQDATVARNISYGDFLLDETISKVRPDIYVGVEDSWGIGFVTNHQWWNKIPCIVHTTIDSRPLLPEAIDIAKKTNHFYCWADFATQEFHKIGLNHVKTLRGSVNTKTFKRLSIMQKQNLRERFQIPLDAYCIGMLSRNQIRKDFPKVIEGYQIFKKENPNVKTRLLFYTHYNEGWNIDKLLEEYGVDKSEVLATYKCRATGEYFIMPFSGQEIANPKTGHQKSMVTVNIVDGLTEEQVNEWYNILDVYVHAFTSGGQERAIQEAKLTELITLVTDYSCGEDCCVPDAKSLSLDWAPAREIGTQFIKAATYASSISKQLKRVFNTDERTKREMGKQAREWVLKNFDVGVISAQFEKIFDSLPFSDYNFDFSKSNKDENAIIPLIEDNSEWVKSLYLNILKMEVQDSDSGLQQWIYQLRNGAPRSSVESFFRVEANRENQRNRNSSWKDILNNGENPSNRVLINIPESIGDCIYVTSLLKDAREQYKDKIIYIATKPQFKEIFQPLIGKFIDNVIDWMPEFDNSMMLEGYNNEKFFDVVLQPHFATQRMINYLHNSNDKSKIDLFYQ